MLLERMSELKHHIKKISKIVDELNTYFLKKGSNHVSIDVLEGKKYYEIRFVASIRNVDEDSIKMLKKCLDCDRLEEMEEYYWELTGESDTDTELSIIGMMTDDYELSIQEDKLKLTIYKKK